MLLQGVETLPFGSRRVLIAFRIGIGSWCGNWRGGCETWRQICYTKMLGGKLEFLPFFSCWNFLHSPKKSFLVVHCSSHNFTFCRQKLGDHQGRRSATVAQMVCSFWAIAWIPKSPLVDLAIPPWMPGSTARVTRCFSGRWGGVGVSPWKTLGETIVARSSCHKPLMVKKPICWKCQPTSHFSCSQAFEMHVIHAMKEKDVSICLFENCAMAKVIQMTV